MQFEELQLPQNYKFRLQNFALLNTKNGKKLKKKGRRRKRLDPFNSFTSIKWK
jgi:hypothetical protein